MLVIKEISDLKALIHAQKAAGKTVGFVPTMGALHAGHRSLVEEAGKQSDFVVVSIFVNPTQFNDKTDLEKYPRTLEADVALKPMWPCWSQPPARPFLHPKFRPCIPSRIPVNSISESSNA